MRRGSSILAAMLALTAPSAAQTDSATEALAGHNAEMRQLTNPDPLRRPLFFDPVAIEGPTPGVPCDHLAGRRPDAIAGAGWVVLMEGSEPLRTTIRYWLPPPAAGAHAPVEDAVAFARDRGVHGPVRVIAVRKFAWCR